MAVQLANIIICATSSTSPLFPSSWVRVGTHVVLIGSYTPEMHECDRELVQRAINPSWKDSIGGSQRPRQILLVDSREACMLEAGELIDARIEKDQIAEIGELVMFGGSGELIYSQDEQNDEENDGASGVGPITMFKSVGVGVQDVVIACAVVAKAEELGIGTRIEGYDV